MFFYFEVGQAAVSGAVHGAQVGSGAARTEEAVAVVAVESDGQTHLAQQLRLEQREHGRHFVRVDAGIERVRHPLGRQSVRIHADPVTKKNPSQNSCDWLHSRAAEHRRGSGHETAAFSLTILD